MRAVGVKLIHADLNHLARRRASSGGVTGYADITGTYRDGVLTVARQVAATPVSSDPVPFHDRVPCTAPSGGWPRGAQPDADRAVAYEKAHPTRVFEVALLNPSRYQSVLYVLAAQDQTAVEHDLRATYGARLCVAKSAYSVRQLRAARHLLDSISKRRTSRFYEGGSGGLSPAAQPLVTASVAVLAARDARAIDEQPAGLWRLSVWLKPAGH